MVNTLPNAFIATLKQTLQAGGSDSTILISTLTTGDGTPFDMSFFAQIGGVINFAIEPQLENTVEYCQATGFDLQTLSLTGVTRGLNFENNTSDPANNSKYHIVGATIIITWGNHDIVNFVDRWTDQTIQGVKSFTPGQNPNYASQPSSFNPTDLIDEQEAERLDAIILAEAEAYADRVAGLSSGISGKPMTFALPGKSGSATTIALPVYMNQEALIFKGQAIGQSHATTIYLQDANGAILSRAVETDYTGATAINSAVLIGGSLFLLLNGPSGYRVYKYDATNLSSGGTLMTLVGGTLGTQAGLIMTSNSTDFFFNYQSGHSTSDNVIDDWTYAGGTTLTFGSSTTMASGSGYFNEGFGVDISDTYFGFSLANQNISKWNSSGVLGYTSGTFAFAAGFEILNWSDTFYVTDTNANQDYIYVKVYIPGTDLNSQSFSSGYFNYGEIISVNDYVFQATGTEVSIGSNQAVAGGTTDIGLTSIMEAALITSLPSGQKIGSIVIDMYKQATPTGNAVVHIVAAPGGVIPTSPTILATSNPFNVATLTNSAAPITFTFPTAFQTLPSTDYGFIIDASGTTVGGSNALFMVTSSGAVGLGHSQSVDGGVTWSGLSSAFVIKVNYVFDAGSVYLIDEANIFNSGPYMGFALTAGPQYSAGYVQLLGIAQQFVGLTESGQVYADQTNPGGYIQTLSSTAGRALGVAISPTQIEMYQLKKVSAGVSLSTGGGVVPADGTLIVHWNQVGNAGSSGSVMISTDNFTNDAGIAFTQGVSSGSGAGGEFSDSYICIPVKSGSGYKPSSFNIDSVTFYRTING